MSRTPLPTLKAPRDQDRTDRAPFEVLPGEADHPELAAWGENVGAPLSLDLAAPLARGTTEIDLLSWNLAIGTARLGEVLERIGPRERPLVILAQEAFRTDASVPEHPGSGFHGGLLAMPGERRSIEQVAREHGLSLRYAPSMRNGAERSDRGNAVLASVAIRGAHAFALPHVRQRRVAVAAELDGLPGLTFVSAHLDTWGQARTRRGRMWAFGSGRAAQAAELGRRLLHADAEGGIVLGADLNTPLGSRDPALLGLLRTGFNAAVHVGRWSHTFHGSVRLRLDHVVFHSGRGRIRSVEVTRLDENPRDAGERVFGSDHHPLLARAVLGGASTFPSTPVP